MAISKLRLTHKDGNIIHLETSSDLVLRSDGTTVENKLSGIDTSLSTLQTAINNKAGSNHTHSEYADKEHSHSQYLTSHQSLSSYATKTYVDGKIPDIAISKVTGMSSISTDSGSTGKMHLSLTGYKSGSSSGTDLSSNLRHAILGDTTIFQSWNDTYSCNKWHIIGSISAYVESAISASPYDHFTLRVDGLSTITNDVGLGSFGPPTFNGAIGIMKSGRNYTLLGCVNSVAGGIYIDFNKDLAANDTLYVFMI